MYNLRQTRCFQQISPFLQLQIYLSLFTTMWDGIIANPVLSASRWVASTLIHLKSSTAGTRGFLSGVLGRLSWFAAPCTSPTPIWPEQRSTLPTTPTPPRTNTPTSPSTTSTPTSAWWTTTPEREHCTPGTTVTRSSIMSHCFTLSGAMDRFTPKRYK